MKAQFVLHTILFQSSYYKSVQRSLTLRFYDSIFENKADSHGEEKFKWRYVQNLCSSLILSSWIILLHTTSSPLWIHGSRCGSWKEPAQWRRHLELMTVTSTQVKVPSVPSILWCWFLGKKSWIDQLVQFHCHNRDFLTFFGTVGG